VVVKLLAKVVELPAESSIWRCDLALPIRHAGEP
jgi:hypothetical protein